MINTKTGRSTKFIDLAGNRYGRLVVISRDNLSKTQNIKWLCRCDCGVEKSILGHSLKSEHTKSCGCLCKKSSKGIILTYFLLKEHLHYNPDTGIFVRLISDARCVKVGEVAGGINSDGYINIRFSSKLYRAHRLAWLYVYGKWPKNQIDHINGDRSDNRIVNLREATNAENTRNCGKRVTNTSGYKCVSWHKKSQRWIAQCRFNGKSYCFGLFDTPEEASIAYQSFIKKHHGEFYRGDKDLLGAISAAVA